jgi:hypothetical protein
VYATFVLHPRACHTLLAIKTIAPGGASAALVHQPSPFPHLQQQLTFSQQLQFLYSGSPLPGAALEFVISRLQYVSQEVPGVSAHEKDDPAYGDDDDVEYAERDGVSMQKIGAGGTGAGAGGSESKDGGKEKVSKLPVPVDPSCSLGMSLTSMISRRDVATDSVVSYDRFSKCWNFPKEMTLESFILDPGYLAEQHIFVAVSSHTHDKTPVVESAGFAVMPLLPALRAAAAVASTASAFASTTPSAAAAAAALAAARHSRAPSTASMSPLPAAGVPFRLDVSLGGQIVGVLTGNIEAVWTSAAPPSSVSSSKK